METVLSPPRESSRSAPDPPAPATPAELPAIGVGIDTSRYGHYAAFLDAALQPGADELKFAESAKGYEQLRDRLGLILKRRGPVHLSIRIDAAGPYAQNLEAFLRTLPGAKTISCGDPRRNKSYRAALFGDKKSDPIEARAAARFALTERPDPARETPEALRLLRDIASRLDAQVRHVTRVTNQLHNLLARVFPELALVTLQEGQKGIALGHAMRKLLHLVYAVWKTGKPYDPAHYPADRAAGMALCDAQPKKPSQPETSEAAGHNRELSPGKRVVTAASNSSLSPLSPRGMDRHRPANRPLNDSRVDFLQLRGAVRFEQVLEHTGHLATLKGRGPQRRGPCPLHSPNGRGRTLSVHLGENRFQCFDTGCGRSGDVIDFWAALHRMPLREAALDLERTFNVSVLPPANTPTEKRNG